MTTLSTSFPKVRGTHGTSRSKSGSIFGRRLNATTLNAPGIRQALKRSHVSQPVLCSKEKAMKKTAPKKGKPSCRPIIASDVAEHALYTKS